MKKKLIALTLAILLICSVAIPASAALQETTGIFNGCRYSTYSNCQQYSYNCIMEYLGSTDSSSSYLDYTLKVDVYYYNRNRVDKELASGLVTGTGSTRIASNSRTVSYELEKISARYYVNGVQAKAVSVNAG